MADLGSPRTLSADEATCLCVGDHNPNPHELHVHHIVPLAFGGPDVASNEMPLCPTTHSNVHRAIREFDRYGEFRSRWNAYTRDLARRAIEGRA